MNRKGSEGPWHSLVRAPSLGAKKQVKASRRESFARLVPSRPGVPLQCLFMHVDINNLSAAHLHKKPRRHSRARSSATVDDGVIALSFVLL